MNDKMQHLPKPESGTNVRKRAPVRNDPLVPEPALLNLRYESHPPLCVGLVWFGLVWFGLVWTIDLLADVIKFRG